jgi:glycolate dehydrogenase iron-sulfur subunit
VQTAFTPEQRDDSDIQVADRILRSCVHCGFCLATCPTYVLLGDELDSPRGRIYQIKDMLESGEAASEPLALHLDRCLSCLSCMTTCPSSVDYGHLVDLAREKVEETHKRPFADRFVRGILARLLPNPGLFRLVLVLGRIARPFRFLLPPRLRSALDVMPPSISAPSPVDQPQIIPAEGTRKKRVVLLSGCAQQVLDAAINEATVRVLTRHGVEVIIAKGQGCCGALEHHMGRTDGARARAMSNIEAWLAVADSGPLDAVVINASGCGTMVKDYGFIFRDDPELAEPAARIANLAKDISEVLTDLDLKPAHNPTQSVAYHSACSMQHGQRLLDEPKALLRGLGFDVRDIPEGHLCCGSAGTYNLLQPDMARALRDRKIGNISKVSPDVVATGNIGCIMQLRSGTRTPVVHTVQLIDWATGGPDPLSR